MAEARTDRLPESKRIGGALNMAFSAGIITNAMVNANSTLTTLKAAVTAGTVGANGPLAIKTNEALDRGKSLGYFSETHGVTTVAGLVALTDAGTTLKQGFLD